MITYPAVLHTIDTPKLIIVFPPIHPALTHLLRVI